MKAIGKGGPTKTMLCHGSEQIWPESITKPVPLMGAIR